MTNAGLISSKDLLRQLRVANFDLATGTRVRLEMQLGPVTCKSECSYCCYAKIVAPTYVGVFIYLYLKHTGAWTPELREKLRASDREMTVRSHRGWLMGRRPCPFLKEKAFGRGTCTIYPARPEACAATHSVAGDGAICAVPGGENLVSVVDDGLLLPFLPLLMAIERYCPPIATTLPASVLVAEASLAGLPLPDVAIVDMPEGEPRTGWVEQAFDEKFVTVADGE